MYTIAFTQTVILSREKLCFIGPICRETVLPGVHFVLSLYCFVSAPLFSSYYLQPHKENEGISRLRLSFLLFRIAKYRKHLQT